MSCPAASSAPSMADLGARSAGVGGNAVIVGELQSAYSPANGLLSRDFNMYRPGPMKKVLISGGSNDGVPNLEIGPS